MNFRKTGYCGVLKLIWFPLTLSKHAFISWLAIKNALTTVLSCCNGVLMVMFIVVSAGSGIEDR
jgi:hypothetical protein